MVADMDAILKTRLKLALIGLALYDAAIIALLGLIVMVALK